MLDAMNLWSDRDWCGVDHDQVLRALREDIGQVELVERREGWPAVTEIWRAEGWIAHLKGNGAVWCVHARRIDDEDR